MPVPEMKLHSIILLSTLGQYTAIAFQLQPCMHLSPRHTSVSALGSDVCFVCVVCVCVCVCIFVCICVRESNRQTEIDSA